jgi:AbrB family looped-hinge helix DNA binding protein
MDAPNAPISTEDRRVGDYIGSVNQQGRVTIPDEVRRALDIHSRDKVVFRITENTVTIAGKLPTLEELAGSVSTRVAAKNLNEIIHEIKDERAERLIHECQQP